MKWDVWISTFCGGVIVFGLLYGLSIDEQNKIDDRKSVKDIPPLTQLIPVVEENIAREADISNNERKMVAWPTPEEIKAQGTAKDRSGTIRPEYPQGPEHSKPTRLGALSPVAARAEAEQWIRDILKPEWIPTDLNKRVIPIQRDPASDSEIICRYEINDHAIQIKQNRRAMWIVIKPSAGYNKPNDISQFGATVFKTFFTKGDRMAERKSRKVIESAGIRIFAPDSFSSEFDENWWGWLIWYTNGDAVAVNVVKCIANSQRIISRDDPWF